MQIRFNFLDNYLLVLVSMSVISIHVTLVYLWVYDILS